VFLWVTGLCEAVKASVVGRPCFFLLSTSASRPSNSNGSLDGCNFYQLIDGDEKFDRRIMFFPYDPWKSVLYPEFVRWVPPPSNPPEMINMEKLYVALDHRVNPSKCHCDKVAVLQEPSKDRLFTLFYRCAQRDNVSIASMILFSEVICVIHIIIYNT
jgi:hypothetical protein